MKQALIIIDAQQELIDGKRKRKSSPQQRCINTINLVIEKALALGIELIFIRNSDVAEGKGIGFEVHSDIQVPPSAKIFDKRAANAFFGTPLLNQLKDNEIKHIVIMGCKTEHCMIQL